MNTSLALKTLNVNENSTVDEIKAAYRKMALKHHPDRNHTTKEDAEFKKITEAYNHLKKNNFQRPNSEKMDFVKTEKSQKSPFKRKPWGAPEDERIPEQDWSKYTKEFEEGDPDFWKEYEKNFWDEYNARARPDGRNGEFDKAKEPKNQPNLKVNVDKSLCIGCCSCEIIAPNVFEINKRQMSNPKSSVKNEKGAGVNKIMDAAVTCPTKAIIVENRDTNERLYPY